LRQVAPSPPSPLPEGSPGMPADRLVQVGRAEQLAEILLEEALRLAGPIQRSRSRRVGRIMADPDARSLLVALTDEVLRVANGERAASLLAGLVGEGRGLAAFSRADRLGLRLAALAAPLWPEPVLAAVRARVRAELAGVVIPDGYLRLAIEHLRRAASSMTLNVNLLGESVLGDDQARRRLEDVCSLLRRRYVRYVSVKISSVCAGLEPLAFEEESRRVADALEVLFRLAASFRPAKFVNLDMESYADFELTLAAFKRALEGPELGDMGAGVVLQAYLPDSYEALEDLISWARDRHRRHGGWVRVRLVKGANLASELVGAELGGWPPPTFLSKVATDANFKRLLELALQPANSGALRVAVGSHNLFDLAWAESESERLGRQVELEMLSGMYPSASLAVARRLGGLRLYLPVVGPGGMESAVAYLVRRLDEEGSPENFLSRQWVMAPGSSAWESERSRFQAALALASGPGPPRPARQDRCAGETLAAPENGFANQPDTDFSQGVNRRWALANLCRPWSELVGSGPAPVVARMARASGGSAAQPEVGRDPNRAGQVAFCWQPADHEAVDRALAGAAAGGPWQELSPQERRQVLRQAAATLACRRGRLLAVMANETGKTLREGDPEVSEAVDFATYYGLQSLGPDSGVEAYRVVTVASPWNFPLSIAAGGIFSSLAAGASVLFKPAPQAVAVGAELVSALYEAGVPTSAVAFLPCPDGELSAALVTDPRVEAVILTGSYETAMRFLSWRPDLNLHGETSGKNAIVITASADYDQAVADLVRSAFGHAGQKCSAASLAIVEAQVFDDPRFLARLADAVRTVRVGPATLPGTRMGPLIAPPGDDLARALTRLEEGERWLVQPRRLDQAGYLWGPGVKLGVAPGSHFHLTECFGPVLGVMRAEDLEEALSWQNGTAYGLTAGLEALDPAEIAFWRERVEAGNLYVNRHITGAVVGRQPFGGWRRSVVGPGAKAGGPNYVASLGRHASLGPGAHLSRSSLSRAWKLMAEPEELGGLRAEANTFRYVPLRRVGLVVGEDVSDQEVAAAQAAAATVGATIWSGLGPSPHHLDKVRVLGALETSQLRRLHEMGVAVDRRPVAADPDRELLAWVREQSVSESQHRYGNVSSRRPPLGRRSGQ